jgi:hypothetical protein
MEMSGQIHALAALSPGKEHPILIEQQAEWAPEPVWNGCEEKESLPLPHIVEF